MSWIETQGHTWLATHMCAHAQMSVCMCPRTHTPRQNPADPPRRREHQCSCGFPAPWYHAGQIFLSAWMTPWHGVYLDWQLVFIWINILRREKGAVDGWAERPSGAGADRAWQEEHGSTVQSAARFCSSKVLDWQGCHLMNWIVCTAAVVLFLLFFSNYEW